MAKKKKYYAVWKGHKPGVYFSWEKCQEQIKDYEDPIYMSFDSKRGAVDAYWSTPERSGYERGVALNKIKEKTKILPEGVIGDSICVAAIHSDNATHIEYKGIYTATGEVLFKFGPIWGTSQIGEFLALVHAVAYIKQSGWHIPLYSSSAEAMKWLEDEKCETRFKVNSKSLDIHEHIIRAEYWLNNNDYEVKLLKWDTDKWGEIPVSFSKE